MVKLSLEFGVERNYVYASHLWCLRFPVNSCQPGKCSFRTWWHTFLNEITFLIPQVCSNTSTAQASNSDLLLDPLTRTQLCFACIHFWSFLFSMGSLCRHAHLWLPLLQSVTPGRVEHTCLLDGALNYAQAYGFLRLYEPACQSLDACTLCPGLNSLFFCG